jgi:hypothetical protein
VRRVTSTPRAAPLDVAQRAVLRVEGFLFGEESAGRLRATRAGLALVLGLRIALGPYRGLADQPPALFRPVWYLQILDGMPPVEVIVVIQIVGTIAAALVVLGWRERGMLLVAWSSFLVLGGLRASRGKIQHHDVLLLLVCVAFLLAPAGQRLLDQHRSIAFGWPIRTALAVIASVYCLTGFHKVVTSGPAWVLSDNMQNVMYRAPLSGKAPTDSVALFIAEHAPLAHLAAAMTLVIEIGFVAILVWPRVRPLFVTAALALHLSIWFTHGLDYFGWAAVVTVVLIDWSAVLASIRARSGARHRTRATDSAPPGSPRTNARAAPGRRRLRA